MKPHRILVTGLVAAGLGVVLGAFGAHIIRDVLHNPGIATWNTAVEYQFYHALGLIGLGLWAERKRANRWIGAAAWSLALGTLLFSGSLYLLVLGDLPVLAMLTPVGGLLMLVGWTCWIVASLRQPEA